MRKLVMEAISLVTVTEHSVLSWRHKLADPNSYTLGHTA